MDTRTLGQFLKELRESAGITMREAARRSNVSNPYLSQIETGQRRPGPSILQRLAPVYGANLHDLLERAGYLKMAGAEADQAREVERAYQFVLTDPRFRIGTRPRGELTTEAKRFIVEMYEKLTGRRLLE